MIAFTICVLATMVGILGWYALTSHYRIKTVENWMRANDTPVPLGSRGPCRKGPLRGIRGGRS